MTQTTQRFSTAFVDCSYVLLLFIDLQLVVQVTSAENEPHTALPYIYMNICSLLAPRARARLCMQDVGAENESARSRDGDGDGKGEGDGNGHDDDDDDEDSHYHYH